MRLPASVLAMAFAGHLCFAQSQGPSGIQGQVIDGATLKGLPGARVRLQCGRLDPVFTSTNSTGHFRFGGATPFENCTVRAENPGYMPDGAGPQDLDRDRPARENVLPPLMLRRYGVIAGRVLDADGLPVPGARIDLFIRAPKGTRPPYVRRNDSFQQGSFEYWPVGPTQVTSGRGDYRFPYLQAGTYTLLAYGDSSGALKGDTRYRPTYYPNSMAPAGATPIELAEGGQVSALDIHLVRASGVTVSGVVTGLPPAGAGPPLRSYVSMWPEGERFPRAFASATVTGGRFELKDILPGRYVLTAGADRARSLPPESAFGALQILDVADREIAGIEVAMQPARDVEVEVSFEDGCRPVPLEVQLGGPLVPPIHGASTPGESFVIPHVPPNRYWLILISGSRRYPGYVTVDGRDVDLANPFDLTAADPARLQAHLCGARPAGKERP